MDSCVYVNEFPGSIKCRSFLHWLSDHELLKKKTALFRY
jgi:hypothetical protein